VRRGFFVRVSVTIPGAVVSFPFFFYFQFRGRMFPGGVGVGEHLLLFLHPNNLPSPLRRLQYTFIHAPRNGHPAIDSSFIRKTDFADFLLYYPH